MAEVEMIMPRMGESVHEATIIKWLKNVGDKVEQDEPILEIATDKVDTEVPASSAGTITKILFKEGDVVTVDSVIAVIDSEGGSVAVPANGDTTIETPEPAEPIVAPTMEPALIETQVLTEAIVGATQVKPTTGRFYSPLVRNIAKQEGISMEVLETIPGSGKAGRVTKDDLLSFINGNGSATIKAPDPEQKPVAKTPVTEDAAVQPAVATKPVSISDDNVEVIEMDRMRKLIAEHMVNSKKTSPHVTSFVEADVTSIVNWRNRIKDDFQKNEGTKITYTPIFVEATAKAIKEFPLINSSVDGDKILVKKDINIGMATALPSGNLIVPVIRNSDRLNLVGLAKTVNDLAERARDNKLSPDEIQGGTFTITNLGSFGNVMGTPIINQPQVAILGIGAIRKKPAVIETKDGDFIGIRHMMFLSMSYDHRIVDGALGGSFLRRVADILESFNPNREI
ncbi:2-oxo acid dehydrogenase subunit E2 [bacterium AH-315-C07]|nr:2-oxo acid dehydrogenase subunit E2 [bacterium AH-315-C07]